MKCCKILRRLSRTVLSVVRKARLRYTIWKVGRRGNTSERTSLCSAPDVTGNCTQFRARKVLPKAKHSTQKDYVIQLGTHRKRWHPCVIVSVWLMVVSIFLAGQLIADGIVFLIGRNQ